MISAKKISIKQMIQNLLHSAQITINGNEPWDIQIHNDKFYPRIMRDGSLALGESYMDHWWDCERLDLFFEKIFKARLESSVDIPLHLKIKYLFARFINYQTKKLAKQVAYQHYDLGNELFKAMLDSRLIYSCAYWRKAKNLEEAQNDKLELICQKLQLQPGLRLLDIGCGWGGLAKFAAERYNVEVVGVTISKQQYEYARNICQGLPIKIKLQDYRDINETFDRIVSVGMFEHVGYLNHGAFMQTAHRALQDDGLFLLHSIGANESSTLANEWLSKYIFPNGMIPSIAQIGKAAEKLFVMEDLHNFGAYYDQTLMAWHDNFIHHWQYLGLKDNEKYDERFYRMWRFYLLSCAGGFRARTSQLWQIVFSKGRLGAPYLAPR